MGQSVASEHYPIFIRPTTHFEIENHKFPVFTFISFNFIYYASHIDLTKLFVSQRDGFDC
jgi:hypothetical protein